MKLTTLLLAVMSLSASCATAQFSQVQDKDWELTEVRTQPENITFDRDQLIAEGFTDIFTLRFDSKDNRVNGIGAPNRYFAPYTTADKQGISISAMASTLMAAIHEPEKLKEHDFFNYLQNTHKWNLDKGSLELYSKGADGTEAVLIFTPSGKKKK